jgi:DNA polymerase Ligase (LigD)
MPRFVLLEHRWNGVHWDLMFEVGDHLRTWALDAPISSGVDLPARALGDHRLVYLDYEGEVSGGRGTVGRVDRGEYDVLEWTDDRVCARLLGERLVGVAELRTGEGGVTEAARRWVLRFEGEVSESGPCDGATSA